MGKQERIDWRQRKKGVQPARAPLDLDDVLDEGERNKLDLGPPKSGEEDYINKLFAWHRRDMPQRLACLYAEEVGGGCAICMFFQRKIALEQAMGATIKAKKEFIQMRAGGLARQHEQWRQRFNDAKARFEAGDAQGALTALSNCSGFFQGQADRIIARRLPSESWGPPPHQTRLAGSYLGIRLWICVSEFDALQKEAQALRKQLEEERKQREAEERRRQAAERHRRRQQLLNGRPRKQAGIRQAEQEALARLYADAKEYGEEIPLCTFCETAAHYAGWDAEGDFSAACPEHANEIVRGMQDLHGNYVTYEEIDAAHGTSHAKAGENIWKKFGNK